MNKQLASQKMEAPATPTEGEEGVVDEPSTPSIDFTEWPYRCGGVDHLVCWYSVMCELLAANIWLHTHTHTHTHRVSGLFFIVLLQLWIGWTFISYQMVRSSAAEAEKTNGAPAPSPSEQLVV